MSIIRCVSYTKQGIPLTNFSSIVRNRQDYIPGTGIFSTYPVKGGIKVRVLSLPYNVTSARLLRRDITVSLDTRFDESGNVSLNGAQAGQLDRNVKEGSVYEYKLILNYTNGSESTGSTVRVEKYKIPTKLVKINLSMARKDIFYKRKSKNFSKAQQMTLSFMIQYSFSKQSDSNILIAELKRLGIYDLYANDIKNNKGTLDNILLFSVDRLDETIGKTEHIGMTRAGIFIDEGIGANISPPVSGRKYTYRVTAYLVSPSAAMEDIDRKKGLSLDGKNSNLDPQRVHEYKKSREKLARTGKQDNRDVNPYDNIYNTDTLKTGIMKTGIPENRSTLYRDCTGDYREISFDMTEMNHQVTRVPNSILANIDGTVVIKWGSKDRSPFVDFYIITCSKQGQTFIVGNAHPASNNGVFTYVDLTSVDYVGKITYSVSAVMINGTKISPVEIGSIVKGPTSSKKNKTRIQLE